MKTLLLYSTYAGSTFVVAQEISNVLKRKNYEVDLKKASEANPDELQNYDLIVMGSPSWDTYGKEGMPHYEMMNFINSAKEKQLTGKEFALFGLGNSTYDKFCGAVDYMQDFVKNVGGEVVNQPLKIDNYYQDNELKIKEVEDWASKL